MIKEVTMYTVICDRCGKDACEGQEYSCWEDEFAAREMCCHDDWHEINDKDYCPACVTWNADESELIPKS